MPLPALTALRDGSWLTPERLRVYPAMRGGVLALAIVALVATGHSAALSPRCDDF